MGQTADRVRAPTRPLLPPPLRAPAAVLAVAGALVLLALAARYHGGVHPGGLDERIYRRLPAVRPRSPALNAVVDAVPVTVAALSVAVAAVAVARRRWPVALLAAAPGVTTLLVEGGKRVVDRTLRGGLALPSGHTAAATSILLVLGLLVLRRVRRNVRGAAVAVLVLVTAGGGAVGLALVEIGAHYPTDTLAGYATAVAVTVGAALAIDAFTG